MKIIVMGTGPFAVPTIERLRELGHRIPLVVTRPLAKPDAKKQPPRPVFDWAQAAGLPVFEPQSINDEAAVAELAKYDADLFFVCDYGQILSRQCLAAARMGGINLHGSILPRHRGAAPVQWALLRGDTEAGVTVIHMTPRLDAGPALAVETTRILCQDTAETLEPRLATLGVEATLKAVSMLESWDANAEIGVVQDQALVTKAPRFRKSDGQLDFRLPAEYLVRLYRACQPWPGTYAVLTWPSGKQMRVIVRSARSIATNADPDAICGQVSTLSDSELESDASIQGERCISVNTGEGMFLIDRLQPSGKREMLADEFLRGHQLVPGCHFVLPEPQISTLA